MLASGEKLEDVVSNVTIVASKPVLSVSEPDKNQKKEMLDKIKEEGDTVLQSATYNIDLMLCNKSIVSTGSSVRISVGFPEGYGADTEGVVYKAYHFIKKGDRLYYRLSLFLGPFQHDDLRRDTVRTGDRLQILQSLCGRCGKR